MPRAADPSPEQPLTRVVLLDERLGAAKSCDRVEVREIRILPGHPAGLHVHNCPVFGSVVDGSVILQIEGRPAETLRPGDVFYEPEGERIARFDATDEGATFLAYFLLGAGEDPQISLPE